MLAKLKSLLVNLSLAAGAVVVALLVFEAGLRLTGPWVRQPVVGLYQPDAELHHVLTPNFETTVRSSEFEYTTRINSRGLRDREYGPKAPGERRILALGDSFVYGSGVNIEDSFLRLIEDRLGEGHFVVNTGAEGSGTDRQVKFLRMHGASYEPDLVLTGFYVGNDFGDNVSGQVLPYGDRKPGLFSLDWDEPLRRTFHSYIFFRERLYILQARLGMKKPYLSDFDMIASLARGSEGGRRRMERSLELLEMIDRDAREMGVPHAVFIIPARVQVHTELAPFIASYYDLEPDEEMLAEPNRRLEAGLSARGIPVLDLLPGLREAAADGPPLYFRRDIHWTRRGHEVAARLIVEFLRDERLVESSD